ncbi:tRNA (adenine(37)-N6)-methyltransferase isoform X3 [Electrophorus electricus]|uniref:tRNA (adenine(37)-N6)-methyltransferase isoform X3 n=1 Tax=Electrophorus electricus TaxID=8005 RepID=UPI0015D012C8|nr:tRNA (adenine(37)-N6)-methyltransferase isoform X3 [Electrophorus electricus]
MAQTACPCSECIQSLKQQVSVMRKEIRNIRQHADSAVRAHRKQMASLQSVLADGWSPGPRPSRDPGGARASLERGEEAGTSPLFPVSCSRLSGSRQRFIAAQVTFRLSPSGTSARVSRTRAAPHGSRESARRLARVCSYGRRSSITRSTHSPAWTSTPTCGDTLHLSGVDLIAGTPVLDIKPYIPEYDSPLTRLNVEPRFQQMDSSGTLDAFNTIEEEPGEGEHVSSSQISAKELSGSASGSEVTGASELSKMLAEVKDYLQQGELFAERRPADRAVITGSEPGQDVPSRVSYGPEAYGRIAAWIRDPPVGSLGVRFTPAAEQELAEFGPPESTDTGRPRFQFLRGPEDAAAAIRALLAADPRSVYRRTRCPDRLFFFTLDTADITCWFGDGFAEVLRVRPACVTLDAAVTPAPPQ